MICYRDMTFCTRSDDCAVQDCSRKITESIKAGAERMGLGLATADMSLRCATGFRPKKLKCPGCGYMAASLEIELANADFFCRGCGDKRLSDYIAFN